MEPASARLAPDPVPPVEKLPAQVSAPELARRYPTTSFQLAAFVIVNTAPGVDVAGCVDTAAPEGTSARLNAAKAKTDRAASGALIARKAGRRYFSRDQNPATIRANSRPKAVRARSMHGRVGDGGEPDGLGGADAEKVGG
jgi:hypothetical protein